MISFAARHFSTGAVTWEYLVEFQRSNPFIASMAPLLNFTEAQVDELFILASTL